MHNRKENKSKYLFLVLRIAFVAVGIILGIIWVSQGQRWEKLVGVFNRMNLLVFAAVLVIFAVSQLIVSLRWWFLLKSQSIFINFTAAIRLHFMGLFYNNFMPSSVGGDLIRAWYVTHHTEKKFEAALSVFVDRFVGLTSTLLIAVFFYTAFLIPEGKRIVFVGKDNFLKTIVEYKTIFLGILLSLLIIIAILTVLPPSRKILKKILSILQIKSIKILKKLKDSAVIYCSKPVVILIAFGLTVFLQLLVITGFYFLGRNIGIEASVKYYYIFFTLTWVLGAVPVSIGGAVIIEGVLAYMFVNFASVEAEAALALALCQRIVWMITSLPGAVIHLSGAHLPKDISIDYEDGIN